jgi:hypothetical protein
MNNFPVWVKGVNLPDYLRDLCKKLGLLLGLNEQVLMDAPISKGGHVIYGLVGEKVYPAILLLKNGHKAYVIDSTPHGQDASDLDEYENVFRAVLKRQEKDAETCDVLVLLHDEYIHPLTMQAMQLGDGSLRRELHRMIQHAKYTACRIFREGALAKKEVVNA